MVEYLPMHPSVPLCITHQVLLSKYFHEIYRMPSYVLDVTLVRSRWFTLWACVGLYHGEDGDLRGQLEGVGSFPQPYGYWLGIEPRRPALRQAPLPAESLGWPNS